MHKRYLFEEFRRYIGQPVRIYSTDGRLHQGMVAAAYDEYVRIIDRCERVFLVDYWHIDSVEQPHMKLGPCECEHDECKEEHRHNHQRRHEEKECREYPH